MGLCHCIELQLVELHGKSEMYQELAFGIVIFPLPKFAWRRA